jgi:branched-chain amino acid aminotransferase
VSGVVYLNGAFVPAGEAAVPVTDLGLLCGLGAFETMRAYHGRIFRLGAHLERLIATLRWLDIDPPEPPDHLAEAAHQLLRRVGLTDARLRCTITGGTAGHATCLVTAMPLAPPADAAYRDGISAVRVSWPRGPGPGAGHKLTSFAGLVLARRAAERQGAAEALVVGSDGVVVEGAYSNVFVVRQGRVLTPALTGGALPGITRQVLLDLIVREGLRGGEAAVRTEDLDVADEVFVTSTIAEVLPVVRLDGRPVAAGRPGPVTARLLAAYRAVVAAETGAGAPTPAGRPGAMG